MTAKEGEERYHGPQPAVSDFTSTLAYFERVRHWFNAYTL